MILVTGSVLLTIYLPLPQNVFVCSIKIMDNGKTTRNTGSILKESTNHMIGSGHHKPVTKVGPNASGEVFSMSSSSDPHAHIFR